MRKSLRDEWGGEEGMSRAGEGGMSGAGELEGGMSGGWRDELERLW